MCELIPIPNEFDDVNDFWTHPIYNNYEANRLGIVRHVKHKKDIGCLQKSGYILITVYDLGIKKKKTIILNIDLFSNVFMEK